MKLKLKNVRLSFPNLFEATTVNGEGEPAFSANFLIAKDDSQVNAINEAIESTAKDKWGAKADAMLKTIRASDKTCVHNGDLKSNYSGYEGHFFIGARNVIRPLVIDANLAPLAQADGKPYSGCYVNASLELWAQDNKYGKRINATLLGVQFYRDGDAFGGGSVPSVSDFDDVSLDDLL